MSFINTKPAEIRIPETEVLPDNRKRLTRFYKVAHTAVLPPELNFAWGTVDTGDAPVGWTGLRLTNRKMSDAARLAGESAGKDPVAIVQLIYEQIDESAETQVGGRITTHLEDGRVALVDNFIQFSTGTYVPKTVGTSTPADDNLAFLQKEEAPDDGTLRRITRTYVYAGLLEQRDESKQGGRLLMRTLVWAKTVPSTPSGYTLIGSPVQNPNGYPIYSYTFAKGAGLVSEEISSRQDGLRTVTHTALGTRDEPTGVVIRDDYRLADGYTIYTVTSMQSASGSAPTAGGYNVERYVHFLYPGRAKAYSETYNSHPRIDLYRSPPVDALIKATITVSYQTSNALPSISDLWNPTEWATMAAKWVGYGEMPHSVVESLHGYNAVGAPVELTGSSFGTTSLSIFGNPVFGGYLAKLSVTGGPGDPGGLTRTLEAHLDEQPAFVSTTGTAYYRLTLVTATIPAQAALPV